MNQLYIVAVVLGLQVCGGKSDNSNNDPPTMAKLYIYPNHSANSTEKPRLVCDGTLLSKFLILTSAQCIPTEDEVMKIIIPVGPDDMLIYSNVSYCFRTPESYSPKTGEQDVALVKIKRKFNFALPYRFVNLQSEVNLSEDLIVSFFSGGNQVKSYWRWQNQSDVQSTSGYLITPKSCGESLNRTDVSLKRRFCMRVENATTSTVSSQHKRLVGGPALYRLGNKWIQIGVIVSSLDHEQTIIYTDIVSMLDWIKDTKSQLDASVECDNKSLNGTKDDHTVVI